jgi:hypothetical protein
MGGPHRWVALDGCNPSGAAVDTGLEAATRARRAVRAVDDGVWYVPQALQVSPNAPPCMSNEVRDLATSVPATACPQRNDIETYSRTKMSHRC